MRMNADHPKELACPHCGYNVAIIPGNRCPECGGTFDRAALLRWRSDRGGDGPQLWRPITVMLAVPIACGCLIVLSGFAIGLLGAIFAAPVLAIMLMACIGATWLASEELIACLHAREIGFTWPRQRVKAVVVTFGIAMQAIILAASVLLAMRISGL